ncbi:hypothetical protein ACFWQG_12175 [Rhodococcus sp. NPDC058532]|uniref:hypothetical protein n=1 Tax=Rhodococcus sp. NPDC058532 TaxID=3346540 RepID=UPI003661F4E2
MTRTTRLFAGTLATLALTAGLTTATATSANALIIDALDGNNWNAYEPGDVPTAYPGMYLDFTGDWTNFTPVPDELSGQARTDFLETARDAGKFTAAKSCTLGPVGTDAAGRKVGITAGHCTQSSWSKEWGAPLHPGPTRGVEVSDTNLSKYPVYDKNASKWTQQHPGTPAPDPIGWIRWVDADTCESGETGGDNEACADNPYQTDPTSRTDYMVIEFAPDVQLSSQVLDKAGKPVASTAGGGTPLKVNSIYTNASGAPALPGILFNHVELYGARTDRDPDLMTVPTVITTPSSGVITFVSNGMIRAAAGFNNGDSGGPVVLKGTGKWVGIVTATTPDIPPWVNTSAKNILDDLNPRGVAGSGFTPINN